MIGAIAAGILRQILLVIVCAEAFSSTEFSNLSRRGHAAGRLSVDVAVDPPVDQTSVRSEQFPSLTQSGQPRTSALRHTSQLVCFPNESRATAVLPPRLTPPPYSRSPPAPLRLGFEARPAGETGKSRRNSHCVSRPPSRAAYPSKESGVALRHDGFS